MKRFTFTKVAHFDNCEDCPFNKFIDNDMEPIHTECVCRNSGEWIECKEIGAYRNYRNKDGVLDSCPFLKDNNITEE